MIINNILAIVLIVFIYKSRKRIISNLNGNITRRRQNRTEVRDRKFALNSIVLNICCFVLILPLQFDLCFSVYLQWSPELTQMMFTIGVTLFTVLNGSTFFINLTVNSLFYDEFMAIFTAREDVWTRNLVINTNSNSKNNNSTRNKSISLNGNLTNQNILN